jgi:hypothetical protein
MATAFWSSKIFLVFQNLFGASVRSVALRLIEFFGSAYPCEKALSQLKILNQDAGAV